MKTNFQITIEQQVETAAIQTVQGKTPWFVVTKTDELYGPFAGRAVARASGVKGTVVALSGLVLEVSEIVVEPIAAEVAEIAQVEIEAEIAQVEVEVEVEIAELDATEVAPTLLLDAPVLLLAAPAVSLPFGFEGHGLTHCPSCNCDLKNGVGTHDQDVNGKKVKHIELQFECLACGAEFGPAINTKSKSKGKGHEITHKSAVKSPCRLVWDLADAMKGARRKDVIAAAQEQGVAFYTARTQYQLWASVQKEMKAREEQNGNS